MSWDTDTEKITPLDDHSAALWVQQGLLPLQREIGLRVGNLVPQGFEAYARVFHPASRYIADRQANEPVRWSEIASWTGRTAHPAMQFHSILGHPENPHAKPEWGAEPSYGSLDANLVDIVVEALTRFTSKPDTCLFCIWEGAWPGYGAAFAYLAPLGNATPQQIAREPDVPERVRTPEPLKIGLFDYLLFTSSLAVIPEIVESPSFWWPQDRAWCVATDIDMTSTFVGGTAECIASLIDHPNLEAMTIGIDVRIDVEGDTINT